MQGTKGERPEEMRRRREADQRQSWDGGSDKEREEDRDKEKEINKGDKVTPNTRWERQELGLPSLGSSSGPQTAQGKVVQTGNKQPPDLLQSRLRSHRAGLAPGQPQPFPLIWS